MPISHNRPPRKVDNRELRRVVEDVYKDINELKNSINRVYEGPPSPTQGKRGDIAVYKDGKNHVLACKTKDGWARIGLSVPKKHNEPFKGIGVSRDSVKLQGNNEPIEVISGSSTTTPQIKLTNTNTGALGGFLRFSKEPAGSTTASTSNVSNSDVIGTLAWTGNTNDDGNGNIGVINGGEVYAYISGEILDGTDEVEDSRLNLVTLKDGGGRTMTITGGDVAIPGDLTVAGNDIISSSATALTLSGANVAVAGDLTVSGGDATITAGEGVASNLYLIADEGDNNADECLISAADGGVLTIGNKISGAQVSMLTITPASPARNSTVVAKGTLSAYAILAGWHGNLTKIKILPSDFHSDSSRALVFDSGTGGIKLGHASTDMWATIPIPTGYKATAAQIYGSVTLNVNVFATDIDSASLGSAIGNANMGSEINITDTDADADNFLVFQVELTATSDIVYGGYVTIAPI